MAEPNEWKLIRVFDVGASEPFQARFLELKRFLHGVFEWTNPADRTVNDEFYTLLMDGLTPAFLHLRRAREMSADPSSPTLNTRTEYNSFYSALATAYQSRFPDLTKAMGYDIEFLFAKKESRHVTGAKLFVKTHGLAEAVSFLSEQRASWQGKLINIRNNVIIHPKIPYETARIIYTPEIATNYFDNCWQTIEYFIASLISDNLPGLELQYIEPAARTHEHVIFAYVRR